MDDDNWDLHAVVRGYAAAASPTAGSAANNTIFPSFSMADQNPSFDFLLTDDGNMNSDPFQGLHEAYRELCGGDVAPPPPAGTFSFPAAAHNVFQPRQEMTQMFMKPPNHYINMNNIEFNNPRLGSTPAINPPQPNNRQRRRKNQQMKLVREMTQDDLSADSWAWRKYGQKPIKGSPNPRNYYRCSTSKGCAARKQVERSQNDAALFVVSYTGEHTHPRPSHRSSLAGSTRSKLSSPRTSAMKNNSNNTNNKGNLNISSSSASAFTPTTPVAADVEMSEEMDDGEDENNIFMIPNDDEDLFKGFHDSDESGGGGDLFPGGMLASPPWTPSGSTTFRG